MNSDYLLILETGYKEDEYGTGTTRVGIKNPTQKNPPKKTH
jgi:hypothetical protein